MSCHDIGRGMNSVVEVITQMFDNDEISLDAARELIAVCRKGVYWCDGNEEEAVESISRCRCGKCLKIVAEGEMLYSIWNISDKTARENIVLRDQGPVQLAHDSLCEKCFDEFLTEYFNDIDAPVREKRYIKEHCAKETYTSDGEPTYRYPFRKIKRWKDLKSIR